MDFRICQRQAYDERIHVREEYMLAYLVMHPLLSSAEFSNLAYNSLDEGDILLANTNAYPSRYIIRSESWQQNRVRQQLPMNSSSVAGEKVRRLRRCSY